MAQLPEQRRGQVAPTSGIYKQVDKMGSSTGIRITISKGGRLPLAPEGHTWVFVEEIDPRQPFA